jgi:hypothetical protein
MFELERSIAQWRNELTATGINSPAVLAELEDHLRDHIRRLASGLPAHEAFQIAVRELGEPRILKQEFARAGRLSRWNWRENPVSLNIVAACFIFMGLNALSQIVSLGITVGLYISVSTLLVAAVCLFFSCQITVGIGLMHRLNFCRYWAFVFAALDGLAFSGPLIQSFQHPSPPGTAYFTYFCFLVPMNFQWITSTITVGMSLYAIYVLSRAEIRELFRQKSLPPNLAAD